ncbi:formamidopyrimidine-DNA glycosylase [Alkalibacillus flavidus]|uniref:Formamidopyrimidine-DNA glycosylase n=1 Tax=Alkalibacillus flavidus TaxID=546021 RepID=A0ABV2KSR2_9BACI
MPELPEVETVRRTLSELVVGRTIDDVVVDYAGIIKEPDDQYEFTARLKGQTIQSVGRLGKFLLFDLTDDVLVSHLRMEGKYGVFPNDEPVDTHTHVRFQLDHNQELRYKDVRKFGTMHLKRKGTELDTPPISKLGLEPFSDDFTPDYLYDRLMKTTRLLKPTLLDQAIVTGLGNIYVDEVLFYSRLHPERVANTLTYDDVKVLHEAIVQVLTQAIEKGGTSIRTYLNSIGEIGLFQLDLTVYDQTDNPCVVCQQPIVKTKVGGRGTHFCPHCQPVYR